MSKSDAELLDICYEGIEPFVRIHAGARGGSVLQRGPLTGSVLPTSPRSSLLNAFAFDRGRADEIGAELPGIDVAMADAGVSAWGVWIVEGDEAAERAVADYGMVLDSKPRAMGVELADLDLDTANVGAVTQRWDPRLMAEINERAYDVKPGRFSKPLAELPQPESTQMFFAADEQGEVTAVTVSLHLPNGDCTFYWVATEPTRQRQGHARRAMTAALHHAQQNGCQSTTLQASPHGTPLYKAIGFKDLNKAINLWEMRR